MPLRDTTPLGAPAWADLRSSDTERAEAFYGTLFGWTADRAGPELGGYINFSSNGHLVAGCMSNDGTMSMPDAWSVYLASADADATAASAGANGGQVVVAPMQVADIGTMAVLVDPGTASIGVWQPGTHRGFGIVGEPGSPSWFELHTRAYDDAVTFYRTVFHWDAHVMSDVTDFRYTTLGQGDDALAGIMDAQGFLPDGVPSMWQIYFGVADVDAAIKSIEAMGGSTVIPAEDTPFGRIAEVADPMGASFKLRGPT